MKWMHSGSVMETKDLEPRCVWRYWTLLEEDMISFPCFALSSTSLIIFPYVALPSTPLISWSSLTLLFVSYIFFYVSPVFLLFKHRPALFALLIIHLGS